MDADDRSTAELVISELLTNAALHGRGTMTPAIGRTGPTLEMSVTDHGQPKAAIPPAEPHEHGRGLAIVAAVTHDLRIDETPRGRCARPAWSWTPRRPTNGTFTCGTCPPPPHVDLVNGLCQSPRTRVRRRMRGTRRARGTKGDDDG
ncbi:ATP-binding protein [Streptomyces sp. NPDC002779]|uniref:ATP-binding protein n=1 Tax=Streptomyces sp. NPDC002779 TaxID=3364664 RepID=UPI0036C80E42